MHFYFNRAVKVNKRILEVQECCLQLRKGAIKVFPGAIQKPSLNDVCSLLQIDQGCWYGFSSGHYGLCPANYVEMIDASEIEQH